MDPLDALKGKVEDLKTELRVAIETALLREAVRTALSRLITLDSERGTDYRAALGAVGEGE